MRTALLFACAALAACSEPDSQPAPATDAPAATASADAEAREPELMLAGDKLTLRSVDAEGEEALVVLPFDQARGAVLSAMGELYGKPELSRNEECGAGPIDFARYAPITLNFQDDRFVGWSLEDGSPLATLEGLAIGAPRGQVSALRGYEPIMGSTIGDEFAVDGISGIFGEEGVETLWAGTNCIFR